MIVEIWDSKTGVFHTYDTEGCFEYQRWWEEGNGCCDCNRFIFCDVEDTGLVPVKEGFYAESICGGCERFIVTENSLGFHFIAMNGGYPIELTKMALEAKKNKTVEMDKKDD